MSFDDIHKLLEKYHNLLNKKEGEQKKISEIISRISGVTVPIHTIVIVKGELQIKGDSVLKNELFLQKKNILDALIKEGITGIVDIR